MPILQPASHFTYPGHRTGEKNMANNNEYQIRIVHRGGAEELSGWMNSTEQVAQVLAAVHWPQGETYWLLVRYVLSPNCREQILEYPIVDVPSQRFSPNDSHHLQVMGLKNRYAA
jgi:hypothetical protein